MGCDSPDFAERAKNCRVWDVEGREYLRFRGRHCCPGTPVIYIRIVSAVEAQLKKFVAYLFSGAFHEPYLALCERMKSEGTGRFRQKTLLVTTGSEAVENAVKMPARRQTRGAISRLAALPRSPTTRLLTGKAHPYSAGMGLMPCHVYRALYPARYTTTSATTTRSPALNAFVTMPRRKISPPLLLSRYRAKADFTPSLPRL